MSLFPPSWAHLGTLVAIDFMRPKMIMPSKKKVPQHMELDTSRPAERAKPFRFTLDQEASQEE